jgi:tetraacyldisaccharide 4'-kinase
VSAILKPAELLYRGVNRLRRALYRRGILKARRLPKPVLSVGNLAVGGAGKTPTVIAIGRYLIDRGWRVCVLTRGYGRAGAEGGVVMELDAARYGDEPVLIKKRLPEAEVRVGADRYASAQGAECDVFLLDDGFQHLQLARDVDVVIDLKSAGTVAAPARWLREGRAALRDAQVVIARNLRLDVPDALRGRRLYAFSGLADNDQFFAALRAEGLDLAGTRGFADHHRYTAADVEAIRAAARDVQAGTIVTTEKDAVKIVADDITPIAAGMIIGAEVLEQIETLLRRQK